MPGPSPYFQQDGVTIYCGDALDMLNQLGEQIVHTVVTSPPYFQKREYQAEGQIGQEGTVAEYILRLVSVFRQVRRVLRDDGTLWLNLGDTFNGYRANSDSPKRNTYRPRLPSGYGLLDPSLPQKAICGVPWRVALALVDDGWMLRQDIIWHKPDAKPESCKDRCTSAHEYIFLLTKREKYAFDFGEFKEKALGVSGGSSFGAIEAGAEAQQSGNTDRRRYDRPVYETRNRRSVWTVARQNYRGAHFATYPEQLIEPCIHAGCPKGGTVLDPFLGSGTTAAVAQRLGRRALGIELNQEYCELAMSRFRQRRLALTWD